MIAAYYNEHDPEKAEALRWLMRDGWIAPGEVDERDIRDVAPDELSEFAQCHFFAGIGLWSVAARRAGIPDDFPLWSGSCPCQPFSTAGRGDGVADERHLFPHWHWLIAQRRPYAVVGEQVASSDGLAWLDLVSSAMEGTGYAGGAFDLCSAGFGAPNIRQRLFMCWLADSFGEGRERGAGLRNSRPGRFGRIQPADDNSVSRLANSVSTGLEGHARHGDQGDQPGRVRTDEARSTAPAGDAGGVGSADQERCGEAREDCAGERVAIGEPVSGMARSPLRDPVPNFTNDFWADVDWLLCRDPDGPKLRPVGRGSFPLAPRHSGRNGELRAYGDAINLEAATAFLEAVKPEMTARTASAPHRRAL